MNFIIHLESNAISFLRTCNFPNNSSRMENYYARKDGNQGTTSRLAIILIPRVVTRSYFATFDDFYSIPAPAAPYEENQLRGRSKRSLRHPANFYPQSKQYYQSFIIRHGCTIVITKLPRVGQIPERQSRDLAGTLVSKGLPLVVHARYSGRGRKIQCHPPWYGNARAISLRNFSNRKNERKSGDD